MGHSVSEKNPHYKYLLSLAREKDFDNVKHRHPSAEPNRLSTKD